MEIACHALDCASSSELHHVVALAVFYLEACLYNQMCENGNEIFELEVGTPFRCELSPERFRNLSTMLSSPPDNLATSKTCK